MADSIRNMSCSVYARELKPKFTNQKLAEITHGDLRALTDTIVSVAHRPPPFMGAKSY